jgi:YYY domain-containing protein
MIDLVQMWALVEALGLMCLPLTVTVCHNLPDRGWAFSKALGIALLTFCIWAPLMYVHALPFSQWFIAVIVLIILLGNLLGLRYTYHTIVKVIQSHKGYVITSELVFLGMVLLLGWLRTFDPNIQSYEMFMDEGFMAAIMRSPHFPPSDMWFAGYSINYYYYAHLAVAILAKLLGQSPSIAFNTGISMYFGLTAVNLFGVTSNIVAWAGHLRAEKKRQASVASRNAQDTGHLLGSIPYGLLTIIIGLILGNLAATQQWWQNHGEAVIGQFNWFSPSRVVNNTINEFPAFSFLLSCFHAHVLTLAFTILAIGLAFNLFLEPEGVGLAAFGRGWQCWLTLVMTALVLGGLYTMNGWDFPTYTALTLVCIGLQHWLAYQKRLQWALVGNFCVAAILLVWLAFFLFIPFYVNFNSPAQGFGLVAAQDRSPLGGEFLIYGLFMFIFVSFLITSAWQRPLFAQKQADNSAQKVVFSISIALLLVDILLILFVFNSITLVVMGTIAAIAAVLLFYHIEDRAHAFTLMLGGLAFALIAGCELFFLKDVFVDQYPRMNTVFKYYFQAWALLAIACGVGLFFLWGHLQSLKASSPRLDAFLRRGKVLWGIALLIFFAAGAIYPIYAPPARLAQINPQTGRVSLIAGSSLDGLTYVKYCRPFLLNCTINLTGDYDAIRWLNAHVQGDPVIVEAVGPDYSLYGRISAFTGLPTIMGWQGHEFQWRVNQINITVFSQRVADVNTIYSSPDPRQVLAIMARYHAQYLYVGNLERSQYPNANLNRFASFMKIVYHAEGVTIYTPRTQ